MVDSLAITNEKAAAKDKIVESIRDLCSMQVKLPLGNPALKQVHTNQFMWIDLPEGFEVANMKVLAKALNSEYARWSGLAYEKNRWYIEGTTIYADIDNGDFDITLDLNPFASSVLKYRDERLKFEKAYTDAYEKKTETKSSTTVASVGGANSSLKGGEGTTIDNLVKKIIGNETDELKKAKLIHEWLRTHVRYKYYECTRYNTPEKCYNNRTRLNCADTARLTASMMRSAGLTCYVVHRTFNGGHFWTVIVINGKKYASDQTGNGSAWNTVWQSSGRRGNGGSAPYSRKNGKVPDC